eukprot:scaffold56538_cov51-Cyclotella_meneghiniana.AAC.1
MQNQAVIGAKEGTTEAIVLQFGRDVTDSVLKTADGVDLKGIDKYHLYDLVQVCIQGADRPATGDILGHLVEIISTRFDFRKKIINNIEALRAKTARLSTYGVNMDDTQIALIILANIEVAATQEYGSEFKTALQTIRRRYNYSHVHNAASIAAIITELSAVDAVRQLKDAPAPSKRFANAVADQYSTFAQLLQGAATYIDYDDDEGTAAAASDDDRSASSSRRGRKKEIGRIKRRARKRTSQGAGAARRSSTSAHIARHRNVDPSTQSTSHSTSATGTLTTKDIGRAGSVAFWELILSRGKISHRNWAGMPRVPRRAVTTAAAHLDRTPVDEGDQQKQLMSTGLNNIYATLPAFAADPPETEHKPPIPPMQTEETNAYTSKFRAKALRRIAARRAKAQAKQEEELFFENAITWAEDGHTVIAKLDTDKPHHQNIERGHNTSKTAMPSILQTSKNWGYALQSTVKGWARNVS